eukprot:gene15694-17611_t
MLEELENGRSIERVECEESEEYFGEILGNVQFYQFSYQQFQLDCLSCNSNNHDSTGKRLYAGGHVGIRFLQSLSTIVESKSVLELGCGTGIIGLSLFLRQDTSGPSRLLLTDGALPTLEITEKNVQRINSSSTKPLRDVSTQELLWGNTTHLNQALLTNSNKSFDIVIGCELMYYSTDIPLLFSTIHHLLDPNEGVFIHVHHFRRNQQEDEMIQECDKYNWITVEIPKSIFIEKNELDQHPEWYQIRALITGKKSAIERVTSMLSLPHHIFTPQMIEEEEEGDC